MNRGSKPQTATPAQPQPAAMPQATTTVVQATNVAKPQAVSAAQGEHPGCKPKHNKGKGWAKGHDKHC